LTRRDLQRLALIRVADAKALLDAGQYSGAYYLGGYAVECAIKACIAKQTLRYEFPDKIKAQASFTHDLKSLIGVAGLQVEMNRKAAADAQFDINWTIVKDWSEISRYETHTQMDAESLYIAVADRQHGVLRWLRQLW